MAIIRTEMNIVVVEQPTNQQHEEVHVEDQINLSSIMRRLKTQVFDMHHHENA